MGERMAILRKKLSGEKLPDIGQRT